MSKVLIGTLRVKVLISYMSSHYLNIPSQLPSEARGLVVGMRLHLHNLCISTLCIGVAPITQYTHMGNNSNIQGNSPNVVKGIFHTLRNCS